MSLPFEQQWTPPVPVPPQVRPVFFASPPAHLLSSLNPLGWLPNDPPWPPFDPHRWHIPHLVALSVGPPLLVESPGWFPSGGQPLPARPVYPPIQYSIGWPTEFHIFPYVPPHLQPRVIAAIPFDYIRTQAIVERAAQPVRFVATVVPTQACGLTLGALKTRVYAQLEDDGTYYTGNEVRHALNVAQNLFALLTLCIERTANFTLTAATCYHLPSVQLTDYLVPLRVTTTSGARIRPVTIHQLNGESSTWPAVAGTPTRYAAMGYDLLAFTPQYAAGTAIRLTYAASPTQLSADTDTPEIPTEQHPHLVDYACWWLRLKEGGDELANAKLWLERFIASARKYSEFVRARSYGQKYDTMPFDLVSFDRGRK